MDGRRRYSDGENKRAAQHETTSLITRGLIGLGVAYLAWASNHLVTKFDKATEEHGKVIVELGRTVERIAVKLDHKASSLARLENGQAEIRREVKLHHAKPCHDVACAKIDRLLEDTKEIKNQVRGR